MMNMIREKVKKFLKEALEATEDAEEIRVIGIEPIGNSWIAEAEVVERNRTLPGYRVFEKKRYLVKLNGELEFSSYKQVKSKKTEEEEE
jgi:C4-type Zn-finger protein